MSAPLRPEICVGAVAVEEGNLLLIRRRTPPGAGLWSIPGGRVKPGETLAAAVVREVHEETRQEVFCEGLLGWAERISDDHHFVILDFQVSVPAVSVAVAGDDADDAAWVPMASVSELRLVDGLSEFLEEHGILSGVRPFKL